MFVILKSIAMYSIDLAGFKKILAYMIFLSTKSGVVVLSSRTTLKSVKPNAALILLRNGSTCVLNLSQVDSTFCSNRSCEAILDNLFLNEYHQPSDINSV